MVRVFNKIDVADAEHSSFSLGDFSEEDITFLLFLTTNIANALSTFRREIRIEMLKYMSSLLIQPSSRSELSSGEMYEKILDLLVQNPETIFQAGILRVRNSDTGLLDVVATSFADGVDDNRDDSPRPKKSVNLSG